MTYKGLKKIYDFLCTEDINNIIKLDVLHAVEQTFRVAMTERDRMAFCVQVERMYDVYFNRGGRRDVRDFVNAIYELNKDPFDVTVEDAMKKLAKEGSK